MFSGQCYFTTESMGCDAIAFDLTFVHTTRVCPIVLRLVISPCRELRHPETRISLPPAKNANMHASCISMRHAYYILEIDLAPKQ